MSLTSWAPVGRQQAVPITVLILLAGCMAASAVLLGAEPSTRKDKADKPVTNSLGMKLVLIPKGEFQMGSEELPSEKPPRKVRITRGFYLAANLVTVGQFRAFVKDTAYKTEAEANSKGALGFDAEAKWVVLKAKYNWKNPGFDQGDDHPVVCVSWNDGVAFCKWLSRKEGKTYRLPTEAEWEYACRAGTKSRFSCGESDESLKGHANLADASLKKIVGEKIVKVNAAPPGNKSSGIASWDDNYVFTSPVGKFKPNGWGLYDMHGNAWSWCSDWAQSRFHSDKPQDDPQGPARGTGRCIRGGTWFIGPLRCRSANRVQRDPSHSCCYVGLRVARVAD